MTTVTTFHDLRAPGTKTLQELAATAKREHVAVGDALQNAVTHAIHCGEALAEIHKRIGADLVAAEWDSWLHEHVGFSAKKAAAYMRLFTYRDHLPTEAFHERTGKRGRRYQPSVIKRAERALADQERRRTRDRAAQQAGGAVADAYALIRRAAQRTDESLATSDDPEQRTALKTALTHLHRAEDAIATALKVA